VTVIKTVINTMHRFLAVLVLFFCSGIATASDLVGFWQSNKELTLKSMRETKGITPEASKLFGGDFFGQLIIEYRNDSYRALFIKPEDNVEALEKYYGYKIVEETEGFYLIESYDPLLEKNEIKKLYKAGNCNYLLVSRWQFKEYFCKIEKDL